MLFKNTVSPECFELLKAINASPAFNKFALAGGTSLSLRLGHRLSIDLDFFLETDFESEKLAEIITEELKNNTILILEKNTVNVVVNGIKVQFLGHLYATLKPYEILEDTKHYSFEDITAMKLNAIANRGDKKDFWDYSFLLEKFSPLDTLAFFQRKYKQRDPWHVIKSLSYFQDANNQPDPVIIKSTSWQEVKEKVLRAQKEITSYLKK